jgi:hypothetical protein
VTRLWVVDYDGHAYLRGDTDSDWFKRLRTSERFTLIRDAVPNEFTHKVKNQNIDIVNKLMREKYTWGDQVVELAMGNRAGSNAIELTPKKN